MGCLKLTYEPQMRIVRGREPEPSREENIVQWWLLPDPLAEKYYHISPYAYVANNPINAIDPDGRIVIFINGMHAGSGGTRNYWGNNGSFANAVMKHLNDNRAIYKDGALGGASEYARNSSARTRMFHGSLQGRWDAETIVNSLKDENGNIVDNIKIITHSMGAAFAKGYVKSLQQYLLDNNLPTDIIAFEADFAPSQPTQQSAVDGVRTLQFSHKKDFWAKYLQMEGAEFMDTSSDEKQIHSINTFFNQIKYLPTERRPKDDDEMDINFILNRFLMQNPNIKVYVR